MSQVSRTTAKTYFNTGDIPTEGQFVNTLDSIPFYDDATVAALSGTAWDGSYKSKTLTSNTALTFSSTRKSGVLIIRQDATGGRTLTINGVSVSINSGASSVTIISFLYDESISDYVFNVDTNIIGNIGGGGGDVTAPVLQTATIEDATPSRIDLTYDENLDTGSTPATGDFAVLVDGVASNPVTGVVVTGMQVRVTLTTPLAGGEVVLISYVGGTNKIQDIAGNDAVNLTNEPVTNNVGSGSYDADAQAVIDAINLTAAGPLSTPREVNINNLVTAWKTAGVWAITDRLVVGAYGDPDADAINWITAANPLNWQGTPTHNDPTGVDGVGISPTNLDSLTHYAQDSAYVAHYKQTAPVPPALECYIGTQDATNTAGLYYYTGPGGNVGGGLNNAEAIVTALSPAAGYEAINRTSSGSFSIIRNGVSVHNEVVASTGVPAGCKVRIGAMGNHVGTQNYPSTARWNIMVVGAGRTVTQYEDEYDAVQAFAVAEGFDV